MSAIRAGRHVRRPPAALSGPGARAHVGVVFGAFDRHNFGDLLFPLVSLSVAIILFEGALTLHLAELKGVAASIPNQGILINTLGLQEAKDSSEIENIVATGGTVTLNGAQANNVTLIAVSGLAGATLATDPFYATAPVTGYVAKRTVQGAYKGELFVSPCIAGLGNK